MRESECRGQDSNLHAISGTGPSNQPVYQFQHLGFLVTSHLQLMLGEGLEPSRDCSHRILNPARLPIPPSELIPRRRRAGETVSSRRHRHGAEGSRTPDLLNAIQALSQLSYSPTLKAEL